MELWEGPRAVEGHVLKPICGMSGPPCAARCTVSGAAASSAGGFCGAPSALVLTAYDEAGARIRDGGARVTVVAQWERGPDGEGGAEGRPEKFISVNVVDADDGTYVANFVAPRPGVYRVHVEIDGRPVAGSPFSPRFERAPLAPGCAAVFSHG